MIFISQVLQDAARIAARELSVTPFPAADTFDCPPTPPGRTDCALRDANIAGIWDPDQLVVDMKLVHDQAVPDGISDDAELEKVFSLMPTVNRALRPAFIGDNPIIDGEQRHFLRYPGALLTTMATQFNGGFTVGVPRVASRNADGVESIEWIPIMSEVRANPADANCAPYGPFSLLSPGIQTAQQIAECGLDVPSSSRGIAAVAINYPFQSAMLSGFRKAAPTEDDPLPPNGGNINIAADGSVSDPNALANEIDPSRLPDPATDFASGPYGGQYGLGIQRAFAKDVRPYRNLLLGQAMFRREVIQ
jgi:hypothetical protein